MIIGLSGKARTGKSTVSKYLQDKFNFTEYAFADELKFYAEKYGNFTKEELYGNKTPECRRMLQAIGSVLREEVDKDYWVNKLRPTLLYATSNIVISDVRMLNEADLIKEFDGYLIRIERENANIEYGKTHISETHLDNYNEWDFIINNNGSIDNLYNGILDIVNIIKEIET